MVQYQHSLPTDPMSIIYINLQTLLPIRYHKEDNQFYADVQECTLVPPIGDGSSRFWYIPKIIDLKVFNHHLNGDNTAAAVYPVDSNYENRMTVASGYPAILKKTNSRLKIDQSF